MTRSSLSSQGPENTRRGRQGAQRRGRPTGQGPRTPGSGARLWSCLCPHCRLPWPWSGPREACGGLSFPPVNRTPRSKAPPAQGPWPCSVDSRAERGPWSWCGHLLRWGRPTPDRRPGQDLSCSRGAPELPAPPGGTHQAVSSVPRSCGDRQQSMVTGGGQEGPPWDGMAWEARDPSPGQGPHQGAAGRAACPTSPPLPTPLPHFPVPQLLEPSNNTMSLCTQNAQRPLAQQPPHLRHGPARHRADAD